MAAAPVLLMHESSLEHETGAHPERPERIVAIATELGTHDWVGYELVGSVPAPDAALTAVHSEAHVGRIRALAEAGGGAIDADTLMSAGSFVAAQHAAGRNQQWQHKQKRQSNRSRGPGHARGQPRNVLPYARLVANVLAAYGATTDQAARSPQQNH